MCSSSSPQLWRLSCWGPTAGTTCLPLYLVRPLTSTDYILARFLAFFVIALALVYAGQIVLQAGLILTADSQVDYVRDNWADALRILFVGIVVALFISVAPMSVAAFTTRRAYAAASVIAIWFLSTTVVNALTAEVCTFETVTTNDTVISRTEECSPLTGDWAPYIGLLDVGQRLRQHQRYGVRYPTRGPGDDGRCRAQQRLAHRGLPGVHWHSRVAAVEPLPEDTAVTTQPAPIEVAGVSKWFGSVVAVNEASFQVFPGVTGLLGPNGAGKTTLLNMMCGLTRPSRGRVRVLGEDVGGNIGLYRRIGVMLEHDSLYPFMTGRDFVRLAAKLQGTDNPEAIDRAIAAVNLQDAQDRPTGTYSRGMRQRIRLAASIVHDPQVLILDEPLNGTDPRQRVEFAEFIGRLSAEGKTVLISSHILEEVETLADRILLVVSGKLAAAGTYRAIREKLDERPFHVRIAASRQREMAAALVKLGGH